MLDHRRISMYEISIFDNVNMEIDWYMVYWGIKNKILSLAVAQDYACKSVEIENSISEEELELTWKSDNFQEVLDTIKKYLEFSVAMKKN